MATSNKTKNGAAAATTAEAKPVSEPAAAAAGTAATATTATPSTAKQKIMVPRKQLPTISHMLLHGAPESQGREKTWTEIVGFPLVLLVLFVISFYIFLNSPPSKYPPGRYRLPQSKNKMVMPESMMKEQAMMAQQQRELHMQQRASAAEEATPKMETEVKEEF
jgi:hypothetical protein